MASPVSEAWMHTTVLIQNEWGEQGTGFFVRKTVGPDAGRLLVVTNKHILSDDPRQREEAEYVNLSVNIKRNGSILGDHGTWPLRRRDGSPAWREHPDQAVDVLAFDVTALPLLRPDFTCMHADSGSLVVEETVQDNDIDIGDDVVVLGYPAGLKQGETNYPLARQGMLATRIGERLHLDRQATSGVERRETVRGFLIDGATIPGSSGSPVILKPVVKLAMIKDESGNPSRQLVRGASPLLGIIAQTTYRPTTTPSGHVSSYTGLAVAHDTDTIRETLDLFP